MNGRAAERPVVLVTRPETDAGPLTDALIARGHLPLSCPMLEIRWRDDVRPDLDGVGGLLFTSANGVRALARIEPSRSLPVYAVGDATARAARAAGFHRVESAGGDVDALARLVAVRYTRRDRPLLHVAGSDPAGDLAGSLAAEGLETRRSTLYEAVAAVRLRDAVIDALKAGRVGGAVFFSPRTARAFVSLSRDADVVRHFASATAYCLSPAVARAVRGEGDATGGPIDWKDVRFADVPDQEHLLALVPHTADGARYGTPSTDDGRA